MKENKCAYLIFIRTVDYIHLVNTYEKDTIYVTMAIKIEMPVIYFPQIKKEKLCNVSYMLFVLFKDA